jgi:hypothetical protein
MRLFDWVLASLACACKHIPSMLLQVLRLTVCTLFIAWQLWALSCPVQLGASRLTGYLSPWRRLSS